ncbi:NAD(P)/FAD-dependent oxidoreductase [Nocardioides zeae]|uniref:FAD-binding oxidoreductase n=1 Tax=Nocardioides zeae TaxID=1457234 RepID=A0A6P0HPX9_9ACTN|nr:FAD-dependent oxidoreductase [Nocardioides zeae]NEN80646.1 FAD-binding oxidoreductase [Nocardioides zeae]
MDRAPDVVVIGAGIVGASTALELARAGFSVSVVDKAAGPGHGSTSASSAVVRYNYSTWDGMAAAWESKFRWEKWEDHLGFVDPDGMARFNRCGLAFLDVEIMPRDRMVPLLASAGIPFEEWGPVELRAAFPGLDTGRHYPPKPVTSEEFFADADGELGAVWTPDAGYVDDPQRAAANLAGAATQAGARFTFRRSVVSLERTGETWRVGLDDGSVLEAAIVVNGAGPWSTRINALAGVGGDFTVHVGPMRQEVHHVTAPSSLPEGHGILADADLGTYLRGDSGHHLLVGGTEPECDPLEWIDDPDAADLRPTQERFEAQVFRAARRLPDLAVPNRPRGLAGVYDAAEDWTPIYDRTEADGFFVAMGTSGNQFKNAPLIGSLMRTLVEAVTGGHDHDADPLVYVAPHTGHEIDLGSFSRRRQRNTDSSGTVLG